MDETEVDQKAREVLRAAANFYETGGNWGQGNRSRRPDDTHCLGETLNAIIRGADWGDEVWFRTNKLFREKMGIGVVHFNDTTTTTKEDVIRVCKEVADQ